MPSLPGHGYPQRQEYDQPHHDVHSLENALLLIVEDDGDFLGCEFEPQAACMHATIFFGPFKVFNKRSITTCW